jgi:hypothetical protein
MQRCAVLASGVGLATVACGVALAASGELAPLPVGDQIRTVERVVWDSAGDKVLIAGEPRDDRDCCERGLWLMDRDGNGTRLDAGGEATRGAQISSDGTTVAWISPGGVVGRTRVEVRRDGAGPTSTGLPRLPSTAAEPSYSDTVIGPTGRVFAILDTAATGSRLVEIPPSGPATVVPGQAPFHPSAEDPGEQVAVSPDHRAAGFCGRIGRRTVLGRLDLSTGRLSERSIGSGFVGYCRVTDGGMVATTISRIKRTRLVSYVAVWRNGKARAARYRNGTEDQLEAGPTAMLTGIIGRHLALIGPAGGAPRRVRVPANFKIGEGSEGLSTVTWSADGRRAALAYSRERAAPFHCAVDRLLVFDVASRRPVRPVLAIPGQRVRVNLLGFDDDGSHVALTTIPACPARSATSRAWAIGATGGGFVDLGASGFPYAGTWSPPGLNLVARDPGTGDQTSPALYRLTSGHVGDAPLFTP